MKAMILAAGLGTRMNELSKKIPKPLLPVFNIPLIHYQLYQLKKVGVTDVVLNLHHFGNKIKKTLGTHFDGVKLHYSEEKPKILGTGGGIKHAQNLLDDQENFILLNSDFVTDLPLKELMNTHAVSGALATLLVVSQSQEPADLNIDRDGFISEFTKDGKYMFCGVHILENRILNYLKPGYSCIIKDGYENLLKKRMERIKVLIHKKPFHNFGTFDLYLKNQLKILSTLKQHQLFFKIIKHFFPRLKELKKGIWITGPLKNIENIKIKSPVFIGKNVRITNKCTIGPHVVLGDGVIIHEKSTIKNSIVFNDQVIKKNSKIINQIIF